MPFLSKHCFRLGDIACSFWLGNAPGPALTWHSVATEAKYKISKFCHSLSSLINDNAGMHWYTFVYDKVVM